MKREPETTRKRVLDAALRVFEERGYGASVDEIAKEAGVAKGTVYLHFDSKENLFVSVLIQAYERLEGRIREVLATPLSPCERARRVIEVVAEEVAKHKNLLRAVGNIELSHGSLAELRRVHFKFVMEMAEGVRREMEMGAFASGDPVVITLALLGAVQGSVFFWTAIRERDPREISPELVRVAWRILGCPEGFDK